MLAPTKINIVTTYYSDNLGDAVIGDSFAHLVLQHLPNAQIQHVDLSGRTAFGKHYIKDKSKMQHIMAATPKFLRPLWVWGAWQVMLQPRIIPLWKALIEPQSPIIIGGGQLLIDNDLNYPLKLNALFQLARKFKSPVAINSISVGKRWSLIAKKLLKRGIKESTYFSVRDEQSFTAFKNYLPITPRLSVDPAVCSADAYNVTVPKSRTKLPIGFGIASPMELKTVYGNKHLTMQRIAHFWLDLTEQMAAAGEEIVLFTNGSAEDEAFLEFLKPQLPKGVTTRPRPVNPVDLIQTINGFRAIIAHRMHANIIAYSLKIPSVGLGWDEKVQGFFDRAGRSEFVISPDRLSAPLAQEKLQQALTGKFPTEQHKVLQQIAHDETKLLLESLNASN